MYQALINCWGFGSTIDRADVVLVMFDPDKPGTTFETLHVLTTGLLKYSSKLLLILNKVDDFETVHDFARAYGALCWNLSKVIPRKVNINWLFGYILIGHAFVVRICRSFIQCTYHAVLTRMT